MEENKVIGIDLLKDLASDAISVSLNYVKAREDGNVTRLEYVGMVPGAFRVIKDLLGFPKLLIEIKDIDSDERKELLEHIISLGILGNKAQIILVNLLEIVEKEISVWDENVQPIIQALTK